MTGLSDQALKSMDDVQEGDECSTSSLAYSDINNKEGRRGDFADEPSGSFSKRSASVMDGGNNNSNARKKEDVYGSEGDLLWKALVVTLLVMIGTAAGFIFLYGLIQGDVETTAKFQEYADLLQRRSLNQVQEINGGMASWSVHGSSFASVHPDVWPFHHFSHFELLSHDTQEIADAVEGKQSNVQWIATAPLVSDEIRNSWEVYSVEQLPQEQQLSHTTNTITKPQKVRSLVTLQILQDTPLPVHYQIHRYDQDSGELVAEEPGTGPYTPIFQMSHSDRSYWNISVQAEAISTNILYNLNLMSIPAFARAFSLVQFSGKTVLSEPILLEDNFYASIVLNDQEDGGVGEPYSILVNPIMGVNSTLGTPQVVGALVGLVPYKAFFDDIVPADAEGLTLVVRPSAFCAADLSAFTFTIANSKTTFKSDGDTHDVTYNFHETKLQWEPFVKEKDAIDSEQLLNDYFMAAEGSPGSYYCAYELYIYPTDLFYNTYRSNAPRLFAGFLVGIFLFVYAILNLYGYIVKRKDMMAYSAAQRSAAIVDMFFPAEVKDRLLEEQGSDGGGEAMEDEDAFRADGADKRVMPTQGFDPNRFLDDKPIASLFPETTIIFADIAGFTAWSSEREPSQVFILLETIYGEFDKIAKRRKVFKVETIGDCYLAVTGIPDPQPDHAVIMCQFAREAMARMYEVTSALELTLGPDTSDLAMRMGLHSGPTTAGVLRGRKSHFQLFGDTVNTAARMESTGIREKIQLSQETADLLSKAGKASWIKPREEGVEAKGKGNLPTFWLLPRTSRAHSTMSSVASKSEKSFSTDPISEHHDNEDDSRRLLLPHNLSVPKPVASPKKKKRSAGLSEKSKRLVQWNVALLVKLLAKVAGSRKNQAVEDPEKLAELEQQFLKEASILHEVQEIIAVSKAATKGSEAGTRRQSEIGPLRKEPDPVVPQEVVAQLTDYVTKIAALHPENPFHNFEHASHVTMSTSKLLSRIVNTDEAEAKSATTFNAGNVSLANQKHHAHDTSYGITSDPLTQFSVVFAALIHDVDHPGVSNAILMTEEPDVGDKYKNKSVAEQKSVDIAFSKLMQPEYEALRHYIYTNEKQLLQFRQLIVNSVIATDIFDKEHGQFRKARWAKAFEEDSEAVSGDTSSITHLDRKATIVIEHLIQASDVSHTMQHWHVYQKWNGRLFEEMFVAYKEGRSPSNPADSWYNGELWFFDNYVIPLAKKLETCGVFGVSSDEFLTYATENRKEWASKGEKIVKEMLAKVDYEDEEGGMQESRHLPDINE